MDLLRAGGEQRTTFHEERRFAALDQPLLSTGHLLHRPGYLEKSTDWPQKETLAVEGRRVVITAGNDPPRVVDLGMAPELGVLIDAIRGPLDGDAAALRRAFAAHVDGTEQAWVLTLTPLQKGLLRSVVIEGSGGTIGRILLVQANGDSQDMHIP